MVSDNIEQLGHTKAKRVTVKGIGTPTSLPQIKDIQKNGDTLRLLYSQESDIKTLALTVFLDAAFTTNFPYVNIR